MADEMTDRIVDAKLRTADELVEEGRRLQSLRHLVVFLYPSQEWMAVQTQTPFLRYEQMPGQPPR